MYSGIRLFKTAFMNTRRQICVSGIFLVAITCVLTVILYLAESQKLLYVSASAIALPDGIKSLKGYWILKRWLQPKLFIPGTIQSIELDLNKVGCAEEIEFGEGVQEVILRKDPPLVNEIVDCKVSKVILPQSVTSFKAPAALKKLVEKK